jgi:REP element-mobilizing transposase RayT
MSEKYKTFEDGLFFCSFAIVGWMDLFVRVQYQDVLINSIEFCQKQKGLNLYCYVIMPSHVHIIASAKEGTLGKILQSFKSFTANELLKSIQENQQESRKEWLLAKMKWYGENSKPRQLNQVWQHSNHPFHLYSPEMINQKVDYIHNNPVEAGLVCEPHHYRLSSANKESPIKCLIL